MKRKMSSGALILVVVMALFVGACGDDDATTTAAAVDDDVTTTEAPVEETTTTAAAAPTDEPLHFVISTQSVPDDHHTKALYKFEELIEESSGGLITVQVYDSASLMDQVAEQTAVQLGTVGMVYSSSQWMSERCPAASLVGVPYMISDPEHLYAVMDGQVGQEIFDTCAEITGVRNLLSLYLGTRQLNLKASAGEIMTPADMEGVKLRVPDSPSWIAMGEALGADPTPVAFSELYLALQTGTVEGQDNPLPTTKNALFYEVTDQIVLTGHLVNDVWFAVNENWWQGLSDNQQTLIMDALLEAREYATEIVLAAEDELVAFFEGEGLDVYEPDREAFRTHVLAELLTDELTATFMEGHYDIVQDLIP
jgi:tripartite ATP-independent transporter DctP family solute receptor